MSTAMIGSQPASFALQETPILEARDWAADVTVGPHPCSDVRRSVSLTAIL